MYNKRRANLGVPCVHIASDDKCINDGNGSDDGKQTHGFVNLNPYSAGIDFSRQSLTSVEKIS